MDWMDWCSTCRWDRREGRSNS